MGKKPEIYVTMEEARALEARGAKFKGATLYQTMGPNWREIIWLHSPKAPNLGKKCYVCDTHNVKRLREMLKEIAAETRSASIKET